jgi:hypothetical protein
MPKPFDLLREFAKFGAEQNVSLCDPQAKAAFGLYVDAAVERALRDPALLQGQRVEAMFEALVVSLGEYRLLKPEDIGRMFPDRGFRAPDFRIVLKDGSNWLIEVKNVFEADPFRQRRKLMSRRYREELEAYAAATGGELKLAVFWAKWSLWTVVSPARLAPDGGDLTLNMMTAVKVNELASLGDQTIGTRPPLRLRLTMDPARTSPISPDGMVRVTISRAQIFCADAEVTDPVEQQIAWMFMNYGEWEAIGPEAVAAGDRLEAIEFRWAPRASSHQGFERIGSLSRMFARYFAEHTLHEKDVVRLRAPMRPEWFSPLVGPSYESRALPLWRFVLQPAYEGSANGA